MPQNPDIFQRMLAGGIIRNDEMGNNEMGEAWEVVFRAQRLSPALNASTTIAEMRDFKRIGFFQFIAIEHTVAGVKKRD